MHHWQHKRLLILLPLRESSGGSHVIIHEAQALTKLGIEVNLLNFIGHKQDFECSYPDLDLPVIYVEQVTDILNLCFNYEVVMATVYFTVAWIAPLAYQKNAPQLAYYIQDFEPWFFANTATSYALFWHFPWLRRRIAGYYFRHNADFRCAWSSYLQSGFKLLTKTRWNQAELSLQIQKKACLVGASYAQHHFKAPIRSFKPSQETIRIVAMIRPASPRRAAAHTLKILKRIKQQWQDKIQISLFGVNPSDPEFTVLDRQFEHKNLGILTQAGVADLFKQSDIFVDFSYFQAMGLTAMEAMAMGVCVICPQTGGVNSFAQHQHNAYIVNSHSAKACEKSLNKLLASPTLRQQLTCQAQQDIQQFTSEKAAYKLACCLWGETA